MRLNFGERLTCSRPFLAAKGAILRRHAKNHESEIESVADVIRNSDLFDEHDYASRSHCRQMGFDPAFHYVLAGEREGINVSGFDAKFYGGQYREVQTNKLEHFITCGQYQGYLPKAMELDLSRIDRSKPVVVVMVHEASRTGAPILGLNIILKLRKNFSVVALVFGPGELMPNFQCAADYVVNPIAKRTPPDNTLVSEILSSLSPCCVISNSAECCWLVPAFASAGVPVITLIHEFLRLYEGSDYPISAALEQSTRVVYPARVVMDMAKACFPNLDFSKFEVLAQGQSKVPPFDDDRQSITRTSASPPSTPSPSRPPFVVAGLGSIDLRKGVDLFVATATSFCSAYPHLEVKFIWIGGRHATSAGDSFGIYLEEQIDRVSSYCDIKFLDYVSDYHSIFKEIDVLYLCSRLDPLPNVAIDAAMNSIPVLCFDGATGFAEHLKIDPLIQLVVPYLDIYSASRQIAAIASDAAYASKLGAAIREMATSTFDMDVYVSKLLQMAIPQFVPCQKIAQEHPMTD